MKGKLTGRLLLIVILFVIILTMLAIAAVPAMAASPTVIPIMPPIQSMGTVTGTLTAKDSSDLAINLNAATTLATTPGAGQTVTILYNKTNSDIESIMLQPIVTPLISSVQPNITSIIPPIQSIGTVTGTLTVKDSSDLAIVLNAATTLVTTPASGQKVTALYNKTNSDIESITLQPTITPITPPVQSTGTVTGTLTVKDSSDLAIILNTATTLATTPAAGQTVAILYNKVNSDIGSIMLQPTATPAIPSVQNTGTVTGTLTVKDSSDLAISLNAATTLVTTPASGQKVTVVYNKTNSDIESIMLQPTITPITPPAQIIGTVTGMLTVKDSSDLAINLNAATTLTTTTAAGQTVTVLYNKTNSDIESIMLQPIVTPLISSVQPNITSIIPPVQSTETVTGTLTVKDSSDLAIVLNAATTLATTPAAGQKVTVLYNKTNSDIESIMLQPTITPLIPPIQNGGNQSGHGLLGDFTSDMHQGVSWLKAHLKL